MLARVPIPGKDLIPIDESHQQGRVPSEVRPPALINHPPFEGFVKMIAPASQTLAAETEVSEKKEETPSENPSAIFDVVVEIPNESHLLRPGMTAVAKIVCEKRTAFSLIGRRFVQMIRFDRLF